ncbi:unnamed protein product [Thlaspi arvense]|uniref:F-box domain-containing protein n=1 Tax=Thlaspi arvense TaxID=13288 RepID=A0AAU9RPG5_THLAR|nr:unnamed protein product [Thlaspi arvense]
MEDDCREENSARPCVRNPSHFKINGDLDLISSLPNEILHHILLFAPTNLAITTSVLSKRWRRVWCDIPSLSFQLHKTSNESISKTLESYSATKITSLHLCLESGIYLESKRNHEVHDIDNLIKFAMSRNVEKLSLDYGISSYYPLPGFLFSNSSLKELIVKSRYSISTSLCTVVSWTSLTNLSLRCSLLPDESIQKILSGSPMLESLSFMYCRSLCCLDLSGSVRLRRLTIDFEYYSPQLKIVAPHIHYLRLINLKGKCTLTDVSSLIEANIDTAYYLPRFWCIEVNPLKAIDFQVIVETMLESLHKVENLTVGLSFLQMLSMAEYCGVPFPTFKVKTLTLETRILRSMITVYMSGDWNCAVEKHVNNYIDPQYLDSDQCWRFKDVAFPPSSEFKFAKPSLFGSFMELLLGNTRKLETLNERNGKYTQQPMRSYSSLSLLRSTKILCGIRFCPHNGVEDIDSSFLAVLVYSRSWVLVRRVKPASDASKVVKEGDVIISFDDLHMGCEGGVAELGIIRAGELKKVQVILRPRVHLVLSAPTS